jgi:hypothetical protein
MNEGKRLFLRRLGLGAAMTMLGGLSRSRASRVAHAAIRPGWRHVLDTIAVGQLSQSGSLSVLSLRGEAGKPLDVLTLDEAQARRLLRIREQRQATVPQLLVDNDAASHVLLLAGEIVVGGRQDRVLAVDLLLPPRSGRRRLDVYCVEAGRWATGGSNLEARGGFATSGVRGHVLGRDGQQQVWEAVRHSLGQVAAVSRTQSFHEVFRTRRVHEYVAAIVDALPKSPAAALGAAVFIGTRLAAVDLFLDPTLFAREWPKLLRAHAVESYRAADAAATDTAGLRPRVEALIRAAAAAEVVPRATAGLGRMLSFQADGARGHGLVFDDRLVHLAVV